MSAHCNHDQNHSHDAPANAGLAYRRVLWIALAINAALAGGRRGGQLGHSRRMDGDALSAP